MRGQSTTNLYFDEINGMNNHRILLRGVKRNCEKLKGKKTKEILFTFMASKKFDRMDKSSMEGACPPHSGCSHAPLVGKLRQKP